nr:rho-related GTP-binding protein RhoE [Zonotrichia albicollis]
MSIRIKSFSLHQITFCYLLWGVFACPWGLPKPLVGDGSLGGWLWKLCGWGKQQLKEILFVFPAGSPYYDNVRPLSYPDSDAVLICFDISRPETLDSVLKKASAGASPEHRAQLEIPLRWCCSCSANSTLFLQMTGGCFNLRSFVWKGWDVNWKQKLANGHLEAEGKFSFLKCSALQSENSVRDIFHVATLACVNKTNKNVKRNKSQRATKRISHMPGRPELSTVATDLRKDKAKSCTVM